MGEEIRNQDSPSEPSAKRSDMNLLPTQVAARFDRADWLSFVLTTALAFAVYWFTLAPNVTLEFSGILSTAAMYAGVPHPPGYPIWTLYSWLFVELLPFANVARRVAFGSAVASAQACGLVAMMISRSGAVSFKNTLLLAQLSSRDQKWLRGVCGAVAGLVLAFSGSVWGKAVIADIWPLSLLLFTAVVGLLMRWMVEPGRRRFLYAAFFLFGLLLTNSQELIVALPGLVCAVMLADPTLGRDVALFTLPIAAGATARNQTALWITFPEQPNWPLLIAFLSVALFAIGLVAMTRSAGREWKAALLCGFFLVLGLASYFYVPLASKTNPPVNWGYPRVVEGFWHVISRGQFEHLNPTPLCAPGQFAVQLWNHLLQTGEGFGWLPLALSALPFCVLRRMNHLGRLLICGLFAVWIGVAALLTAELNPPPDRGAQELFGQYSAASYVVLAVWLGIGLMFVAAMVTKPSKP